MPEFSAKSAAIRDETCQPLQFVLNAAITLYDFTVITGHRGEQKQQQMYELGRSQVQWPNSKHNRDPSDAVDIAPYLPSIGVLVGSDKQIEDLAQKYDISHERANAFVREHYCLMAGVVLMAAKAYGVPLRWGGDWNGDFNLFNNSFDDLMHFEVVRGGE